MRHTYASGRRPRAAALAAVGVLAFVAACGGDPVSPLTPGEVTGTYVLASVGGVVPPIPFGTGTTIVADTMQFARDGMWTSVEASGVGGGGLTPTSVRRWSGTWRLDVGRGVLVVRNPNPRGLPESQFVVRDRGRVLESTSGGDRIWRWTRVP